MPAKRDLVAVLSLLLPACAVLPATDLVLLDNGQRIAGTLDPTADVQADQVAINTGNGIIRLSKERVAGEDLGYPARRAKIKNDDLKGQVALAKWCRAKGMNQEALEALQLAMALPGVDLPTKALYARLIDELKGPEDALPLYQAYRQDGGKDSVTIARLDQLEKVKADFEAQNGDAPADAGAKPVVAVNEGGLESKGWDLEALQWSNPGEAKVIVQPTDAGPTKALQIAFKPGDKDKVAVKRSIRLTIADDSTLVFWAQNPGDKPVNIAIALKTGTSYTFHESPPLTVKPGGELQAIKFDLKSSNFKSAATSWANTGKIANLDDVREMQLLIYNGHSDGSIVISNMGFPPKPDL